MKRILAGCFILCISCQSWAIFSSTPNFGTKKFYLGIGAGDMFYRLSGSNFLGTGAGWPNDHYASNNISNELYGFLAAGYTWERPANWLPHYSLGIRYLYVPNTTVTGDIDQYSLPDFRNYHFSYDIQILSLSAILKADLYRWYHFIPYVLVGAGIANYSTLNYTEQAVSGVTPRVSPAFQNDSGTNFTYQLGVGIDYAVQENLVINVEYDYFNYGTVHTGKGINYATLTGTNYDNESLKNKIAATTLLFGLTYYIG